MRTPRSLASWVMRLMGADSGLTTATSRLAETRLPKPMLTSFNPHPPFLPFQHPRLPSVSKNRWALFNVLHLFPNLLNLRLDIHHMSGNFDIAALGADGIRFPVKLLN